MFSLLIVDDKKSSRELMRYVVSECEEFKLVGVLEDAQNAPDFCKSNKVDLILMDIYTGGHENGIECAGLIKKSYPNTKIIIVTFLVQPEHVDKARAAKLEGFWYKDHSSSRLVEVMKKVVAGETVYPDKLPTITVGLAKSTEFTKQELNVLKLMVNGYAHVEICEKLKITRSTLNYHIGNLKGKTGYDNLLKLAIDVSMKKFIISDEFIID